MNVLHTLREAWRSWWSPRLEDAGRQPLWAELTITFLFSSAIALGLTAFVWVLSSGRVDLLRQFWVNFLVGQCIGFSIHGLFRLAAALLGAPRIDRWTGWRRALFFAMVPLAGVLLGYLLSFALLDLIDDRSRLRSINGWFVAGAVMIWALLSLFWWRFFVGRVRLAEAQTQLAADRAHAAELQRQAVDAQLRALQAQIEPHFLFNTLANVVSLIDTRPADARRMLERLIDLLRGSLSASRARQTTLGQELDLCRAYLEILAIRMRGRLRFDVDAEAGLRAQPVPPLLLQPLVENAIRHGLEPKVEGGRIGIAVRADGGRLRCTVEDDGVGFGALTRGGGVGLANLRERLAACYGSEARLSVEDAAPGTRVQLLLPLVGTPPAAAENAAADPLPRPA